MTQMNYTCLKSPCGRVATARSTQEEGLSVDVVLAGSML